MLQSINLHKYELILYITAYVVTLTSNCRLQAAGPMPLLPTPYPYVKVALNHEPGDKESHKVKPSCLLGYNLTTTLSHSFPLKNSLIRRGNIRINAITGYRSKVLRCTLLYQIPLQSSEVHTPLSLNIRTNAILIKRRKLVITCYITIFYGAQYCTCPYL